MVIFMYFLTLVAAIHPANNTEHVDQLVATKLQLKINQLDNSHKSNVVFIQHPIMIIEVQKQGNYSPKIIKISQEMNNKHCGADELFKETKLMEE